MEQYVISIARQFGSLGRLIAKKLAEELEISYYDRDIIAKTSEIMNKPVSDISDYDEKVKNPFFSMLHPMGFGSLKEQEELFEVEKTVILEIANKESCIIVGRCADYILSDHKNILNIFIYAPYEKRLENCIYELNLEAKEAAKMMDSVDKAREKYYKHRTGMDLYGLKGKDLMIDSSLLGVDGTVKLIKNIIGEKFKK